MDYLSRKEAIGLAMEAMGKTCQSTVLTQISPNGQKSEPQPPQRVYGYEIIDLLSGVELLLIVGGESVLYDTCYNFSK